MSGQLITDCGSSETSSRPSRNINHYRWQRQRHESTVRQLDRVAWKASSPCPERTYPRSTNALQVTNFTAGRSIQHYDYPIDNSNPNRLPWNIRRTRLLREPVHHQLTLVLLKP